MVHCEDLTDDKGCFPVSSWISDCQTLLEFIHDERVIDNLLNHAFINWGEQVTVNPAELYIHQGMVLPSVPGLIECMDSSIFIETIYILRVQLAGSYVSNDLQTNLEKFYIIFLCYSLIQLVNYIDVVHHKFYRVVIIVSKAFDEFQQYKFVTLHLWIN